MGLRHGPEMAPFDFLTFTWAGPWAWQNQHRETVEGSFTLTGKELFVREVKFDDGHGTVRRWT